MNSKLARFSSDGVLTRLIARQIISEADRENVEETALLSVHGESRYLMGLIQEQNYLTSIGSKNYCIQG